MKQEGQFLLFTRDEFREWLFKQTFKRRVILVQNHCTAEPSYNDFNGSNHFTLLKNMKAYHMAPTPQGRGFTDIAQNLTTFPDGMIAVCRPFDIAPAGISGANTNGICIENLGNFDAGMDKMTAEQAKTIIYLNAVLCMYYKLAPSVTTIVYHAWYNRTTGKRDNDAANKRGDYKTCPGTAFFGGNTAVACGKCFVPQVIAALKELSASDPELEESINYWTSVGVIHDPEGLKKDFAAGVFRKDRFRAVLISTMKYVKKG